MDGITVDSGCYGTLMNNGFVLAAKNTICTEASYSYACLATEGTCMEVSRGTETYPQTGSRLCCRQWHSNTTQPRVKEDPAVDANALWKISVDAVGVSTLLSMGNFFVEVKKPTEGLYQTLSLSAKVIENSAK